jgi:hypothetical protein
MYRFCARFPKLLELAQLEMISVKYLDLPYGAARRNRSLRDHASENFFSIFDTVSKRLLAQNDLEIPRGNKITTDEERKKVLAQLICDIAEEGCFSGLAEWIICKPLDCNEI